MTADDPSSPPRPSSPLRVGVVGTAHWATEVHAAGAVISRNAELAAVWGRSREKSEQFAQRYGVAAAETLDDLVQQVDVVTFAVPPQVQPELAVAAARQGRHLLLEKPVAVSLREAHELQQAVGEGGGHAAVFFTRRHVPELERQLATLRQERWSAADVVWHANSTAPDSPYRESLWRAAPLAALWDLTPHVLSQLIPLLGDVVDVSAERRGHAVRVRTAHTSGAFGEISVSLRSPEPVDEFRLRRHDGSEVSVAVPAIDAVEAFACALDQLVADVRRPHGESSGSLALGVETTRILAEAERSLLRDLR